MQRLSVWRGEIGWYGLVGGGGGGVLALAMEVALTPLATPMQMLECGRQNAAKNHIGRSRDSNCTTFAAGP